MPKAVIYRSLQRLEQLALIETAGEEPTTRARSAPLSRSRRPGEPLRRTWLARPVAHARDVRSELLVKLALLDRAGQSAAPLLAAQRQQLLPIAAALLDRLGEATGFEHTLALWRYETVSATLRFLDAAMPARSS